MVEDVDLQDFSGRAENPGDGQVFFARLDGAGRVVVHEYHGTCVFLDGEPERFAGVDLDLVDQALRDFREVRDVVPAVKRHGQEVFLVLELVVPEYAFQVFGFRDRVEA